jgi:hypothetical protein
MPQVHSQQAIHWFSKTEAATVWRVETRSGKIPT